MTTKYEILADEENNAESFWDDLGNCSKACWDDHGSYEFEPDPGNNSEAFWDDLRDYDLRSFEQPVKALLRGDAVVCNRAERDQLMSFLRTRHGWSDPDAPAFAPHPVVVREID